MVLDDNKIKQGRGKGAFKAKHTLYLYIPLLEYAKHNGQSDLVNGLLVYAALSDNAFLFRKLCRNYEEKSHVPLHDLSIQNPQLPTQAKENFIISTQGSKSSYRARAKAIARMFNSKPNREQIEMAASYLESCYPCE